MVFGELTFPAGGVEAWKKLTVAAGTYKDKAWKKSAWLGDPTETTTVAAMLVALEKHSVWCATKYTGPDHMHVAIEGNCVTVRGYLNEDDFRHWCGNLATMLRAAEKVGASGEYVAIANDDLAGERLVLAGGKSCCERVDLMGTMTGGDVPESALDYRLILSELEATTTAKLRPAAEPSAAKKKAAAKKRSAK
jgi:hypothetical protein